MKLSKGAHQTQEKRNYNAAVKQLGAVEWFKEGYALAETRKYRDAISFYNKAIDADPKYATAYIARGWAYYQIRDYPSALKDNNRALDLKPDLPIALANRSNTLVTFKRLGKLFQ